MKTNKIKQIIKSYSHTRVIIGINAYDSDFNELYGYWDEGGIDSDETSMRLHKLTTRKNTPFKMCGGNPQTGIFTK
jgi:hypothetical protein